MDSESKASEDFGTGSNRSDDRIQTIRPEIEPEYVGAHSARKHQECQNYLGETRDEIEQCGEWSTHTVVMKSEGKIHEIAMCDDCGEPQDVDATDRKWSGVVEEERKYYTEHAARGAGPLAGGDDDGE